MVNLTIDGNSVICSRRIYHYGSGKEHWNQNTGACATYEGIHKFGSCRICVVEVEGYKTLCKRRVLRRWARE